MGPFMTTQVNTMPFVRALPAPENDTSQQVNTKKAQWSQLKAELEKLGMMNGKEAQKHSGLTSGHVDLIRRIAKEFDTIVAIRPVNNMATSLIASMAAVKGLDDTHLKSASTGPMAGFIPIDPRLGKSGQALLDNKNADPNPIFYNRQ